MPTRELCKVKAQTAATKLILTNGDELSINLEVQDVFRVIGDDGKPMKDATRAANPVYEIGRIKVVLVARTTP